MPEPISATMGVIGLASAASGAYGAKKASDAQSNAARTQQNMAIINAQQLQDAQNKAAGRWDQYTNMGTQGLGQMANFDMNQGVGEIPSYDKEYWDRLGQYESSPAFQAQNMLGQQDLARSRTARGLDFGAPAAGANASAELSQKLRATDYDKYRQDLASRYAALQGEYGQRRSNNKDQYQQIMDKVKTGTMGLQQQQQQDQFFTGQKANNLGAGMTAVGNQGQADAGFYSGLGSAIGSGMQNASAARGLASSWFGNNSASGQTPYAIGPSGTATMGPWATGIGG